MQRLGTRARARASVIVAAMATVFVQICVVGFSAAPATAADGFRALDAPQRVLDTRSGERTADRQFEGVGVLDAGQVIELPVAGRVGLPDAPAAVVLNVTVTGPEDFGFVTVYPCGRRPTASTLNYYPGQTVPNAVVATVSDAGTVCLYSLARTHLIVDASGWFPGGAYTPLGSPQRLLDTRPGESTADDRAAGIGVRDAGSVTRLPVAGRVGLGDNVNAVVLNVTVTGPEEAGFVTVYPCGVDRPTASNVNYQPGQTVPNLVVAKVGEEGRVCLYTLARAHLIVDVSGALPAATFNPLDAPARLLDTRVSGSATVDDRYVGFGTQPTNGSLELKVTGRGGIPDDASAVILNVTAAFAQGPGYLAVHPRGSSRPTASNVNYGAGEVVANAVVARVGRAGRVCLFNLAPTEVIVDVTGYLTGPVPPDSGAPCPSTQPNSVGATEFLVRRPGLHQVIGTDRVAVLPCGVGADFPQLDAGELANWLNETVTPWFVEASRGAYEPVFEPHPLGRVDLGDTGSCLFGTPDLTEAPFTNVIAVTEEDYGGGQAGPGYVWSDDRTVFASAPTDSQRGGYVGGGAAFIDPAVFIHELGHTIHWPHSYLDRSDARGEYTNPIDIMSGEPDVGEHGDLEPPAYCDAYGGGGWKVWCWPQHTIAFNRLAAGWVADNQVAIHWSGGTNYTLDKPAGDGVQLIALPDPADQRRILTLEARPATGRDRFSEKAGVAVHLIDQAGSGGGERTSTQRRQAQGMGGPETYDHVIAPGDSATVHGVTITVYNGSAGDGYRVFVRGTYHAPELPADVPRLIDTQSVGGSDTGTDPGDVTVDGPRLVYVD